MAALIPTFETPRLILRPHRVADFETYAGWWVEPDVTRFFGGRALSRSAAWDRFLRLAGSWVHLGFGTLLVVEKATGAVIGEVGAQDRLRAIDPPLEGTLEAVWTLTTPAHGKGYATEAMAAFLGFVDRCHAGRRVTVMIPAGHTASLRVAAKLGFVPLATTTFEGEPVELLERHRNP